MSALNILKRLLGFTDDEELTDDEEVTYTRQPETTPTQDAHQTVATAAVPKPEFDASMKVRIFEGVVAVFNEALPDFLKNSVNPKMQQQRLMDALDGSCNAYLDSLQEQAAAYAKAGLQTAIEEAHKESQRLKEEMENVNRARNLMQEQQLSAERRSRALSDRVRDLEEQLARAEAEREQFELENKSLINKLKVADVQPGIVEELTKEVESLREQLNAEKPEALMDDRTGEIEALEKQIRDLKDAYADVQNEKTKLKEEMDRVADNLENASKRADMSEAMYSDLQATLASTNLELENAQAHVVEVEKTCEAKLAEANEMIKNFDQLEKQFDSVADVIQQRNDMIASLRRERKQLREEVKKLKEQLSNAKKESGYASDSLFSIPDEEYKVEQQEADDDFQVPDWFVSEPAPVPKDSESSFGYQEPPRKHRAPDNDAQMTLF